MPRLSRTTRQKQGIREAIALLPDTFAAEDLLRVARRREPNLGVATVYRQLHALVSEGALHRYICGGKSIYSSSKLFHGHFTCTVCGSVQHMRPPDIGAFKVAGDILAIQVEVQGVCAVCKSARRKTS
jgi:Fur family ferric uptake transcriptional regulator